jgi:hypothetical protein
VSWTPAQVWRRSREVLAREGAEDEIELLEAASLAAEQ